MNNKLILVVDDNNQNLKVLSQILKENNYQIALANNGQSALDIATTREVDLMLLDIMMPEMDGFEVCKKLKANVETKDIPVIFISALQEAEKKLQAFEIGGADYISKPFNKKEVMARVKTQLGYKEAKEELELRNEGQKILLENIDTQIWYLKNEITYGKVNSSHAEFLGLNKEELEGKTFPELLESTEAKTCIQGNLKVFTKKEKIRSEEWVKNSKGEKRLLKLTKTPKLDGDGNVEYVVCTAEDITENKIAEKKLKNRVELEKISTKLSKKFIDLKENNIGDKLEKGLEMISSFIGVEYSCIYLFSKDNKEIKDKFHWYSNDFEVEKMNENHTDFSLDNLPWLANKLREDSLIEISNVNNLPSKAQNFKKILLEEKIKSSLILPLKYNDKLMGIVGFDSINKFKEWDDEEISLFKMIADIFVNALKRKENEEKLNEYYLELELQKMESEKLYDDLEAEFEKAKQLHQKFLPNDLPTIKGLTYEAYFKPSKKLGGDFYDIVKSKDKVLFYLADVSGHGLDGSMMNIFLRETINNYLLYQNNEGDHLKANELISHIAERYQDESFPADYFVCLLVGVLDTERMQISFANAGFQFPPIMLSETGEISSLSCSGMPISSAVSGELFNDLYMKNYEPEIINLTRGGTLFLTTDGLLEEVVGDEIYGEQRLKEILAKNYKFPADLINTRVKNDFKEFSGSLIGQDDLTFITLQRDSEVVDKFEVKIESCIEQMHQTQARVSEFISPYYELPDLICIAFQEVVTNAIEHGNKFDTDKEVEIEIEVTKKYIKAIITDEGEGFNWEKKINKSLNIENDLAAGKERGRGIKISNKVYDEIWYNEKGNRAYLFKLR